MEAWYLDDSADDQRKPHKQQPNVAVTLKELQRYGILYWKLDADKYEEDPELQKIRKERNYSWMDIVNIHKDTLPNYEEKLVISYLKLDGKRHSHLAGCLSVKMTIWRHDAGNPAARVDEIRSFFQEHIHLDEEIRYILNGSGYFDVRDKDDKWIRIAMTKGDMITLPAGIYHRFTLDENNYVKAMRLFVGEPVWIPYYRPADELEVRKKYVQFLNQKL